MERAAEGCAGVGDAQRRLLDARFVVKEIIGVEGFVAIQVVEGAVVTIRAALTDSHNRRSVVAAILGRPIGKLDLNCLGGVQADGVVVVALVGVVGGQAVHRDVVSGASAAIHVEGIVAAEGLNLGALVDDDAGLEFREGSEVAVDDSEVLNLAADDDAGAFARRRLDGGALRDDFDGFSY